MNGAEVEMKTSVEVSPVQVVEISIVNELAGILNSLAQIS